MRGPALCAAGLLHDGLAVLQCESSPLCGRSKLIQKIKERERKKEEKKERKKKRKKRRKKREGKKKKKKHLLSSKNVLNII